MSKHADAPSVKGDALPAVTVPLGLTNTGRNFDSFSMLLSA